MEQGSSHRAEALELLLEYSLADTKLGHGEALPHTHLPVGVCSLGPSPRGDSPSRQIPRLERLDTVEFYTHRCNLASLSPPLGPPQAPRSRFVPPVLSLQHNLALHSTCFSKERATSPKELFNSFPVIILLIKLRSLS